MPKFRVVGTESGVEVEADEPRVSPTLSGGDGGGTSEDMERRVVALEKGMEKLIGKLDAIQASIAEARIDSERRFGSVDARLSPSTPSSMQRPRNPS